MWICGLFPGQLTLVYSVPRTTYTRVKVPLTPVQNVPPHLYGSLAYGKKCILYDDKQLVQCSLKTKVKVLMVKILDLGQVQSKWE